MSDPEAVLQIQGFSVVNPGALYGRSRDIATDLGAVQQIQQRHGRSRGCSSRFNSNTADPGAVAADSTATRQIQGL